MSEAYRTAQLFAFCMRAAERSGVCFWDVAKAEQCLVFLFASLDDLLRALNHESGVEVEMETSSIEGIPDELLAANRPRNGELLVALAVRDEAGTRFWDHLMHCIRCEEPPTRD